MKNRAQRRIKRAKSAKYFSNGEFPGRIPLGDKTIHVPSLDLASDQETLAAVQQKGRAEIALFFANGRKGSKDSRLPHEVVDILQQEADILHELNLRRTKEGR